LILLVLLKQLFSTGATHGYLLLTRVNARLVLLHTSVGTRVHAEGAPEPEETIGVTSLRTGRLAAPLSARATGYHHDLLTTTVSSFFTVREETPATRAHDDNGDDDDEDEDARAHAALIATLRFCIRASDAAESDTRVNLFAAYAPHSTSRAWVTRLEIADTRPVPVVVHRTHDHLTLCSEASAHDAPAPFLPSYLPVVCRAGFVTHLVDVELWGDNFRATLPAPFTRQNCWLQIRASHVYDLIGATHEVAPLANFYVTGGIEPAATALSPFELKHTGEKLVPCTDLVASIYQDIVHMLTRMARSGDPCKWLNEVDADAAAGAGVAEPAVVDPAATPRKRAAVLDPATTPRRRAAESPAAPVRGINPLVRAIAYRRARDIRQRVITPSDLLNRLRDPFLSFRECDGFIFDVLFQAHPAALHDFANVSSLPNEWHPRDFYASGDTGFLSMLYLLQWRSTLQRLLELVLVAELPGLRLFIDSLMNNFRVGILWQQPEKEPGNDARGTRREKNTATAALPTYSTLRVLHDPAGGAAKDQYLFFFNPSRLAMVLKPYHTGNLGAVVPPSWVVTGSLQTQCAKQRDSVVAFFVAQAVTLIAQVCNAHAPNPSLESVLIGMYLGSLQEVDLKHTYKHWQRVIRELRQTIPSKKRRVPKPAAASTTHGASASAPGAKDKEHGAGTAKRIKLEIGSVKTPPAPLSARTSIRTLFQRPRARPPLVPMPAALAGLAALAPPPPAPVATETPSPPAPPSVPVGDDTDVFSTRIADAPSSPLYPTHLDVAELLFEGSTLAPGDVN
jgi:hypothetical protein